MKPTIYVPAREFMTAVIRWKQAKNRVAQRRAELKLVVLQQLLTSITR